MSAGPDKSLVLVKPFFVSYIYEVLHFIIQNGLTIHENMYGIIPNPNETVVRSQYLFPELLEKNKQKLIKIGNYNIEICRENELDPIDYFDSNDALTIGKIIIERHSRYVFCAGVGIIIVQGENAAYRLKEHLTGPTEIKKAKPNTLRGLLYELSEGKYPGDNLEAILQYSTCFNGVHVPNIADANNDIARWTNHPNTKLFKVPKSL